MGISFCAEDDEVNNVSVTLGEAEETIEINKFKVDNKNESYPMLDNHEEYINTFENTLVGKLKCTLNSNFSFPLSLVIAFVGSPFMIIPMLWYLCILLVRPPRSQSLLIMGWCSSIPEHRLRIPLDSGPIV